MTLSVQSPNELVLPVTCSLPIPFGSAAREGHAEMIASLRSADECQVIIALLSTGRSLSPAERLVASVLPCLVGIDERAHLRQPLPGAAAILKFLREIMRSMLARFTLDAPGRWLTPACSDDISAVYAAALLFAQQGIVARPWIWDSLPPSKEFMIIGTTRMRTRDPQHARCLGHATLLDLYPNTEPLRLPRIRHSLSAVS